MNLIKMILTGILLVQISSHCAWGQKIYAKDLADLDAQITQRMLAKSNADALDRYNERVLLDSIQQVENVQDLWEFLELSEEQADEIQRLRANFESKVKVLKLATESTNSIDLLRSNAHKSIALKQQLAKDVRAVLLKEQFDIISSLRIERVGLPKCLTETAVARSLDLSDRQKELIRDSSNQVAVEIYKATNEIRRKAANEILRHLEPEQTRKLEKLYGKEKLRELLETSEPSTIFRQYLYDASALDAKFSETSMPSLSRTKLFDQNLEPKPPK